MQEIIFQTIKSTPNGLNATSGKDTAKAFNENFQLTKELLTALTAVAQVTVTSGEITQLKVNTSTTPYTIFYTLESGDNPTWIPLISVGFGNLTGDPMDNIALKQQLNSKGDAVTVANLVATTDTHTTDIASLQADMFDVKETSSTNESDINLIQAELLDVVHTQTGDRLYLRYNPETESLEYSLDNAYWIDITSIGIGFANIKGEPYDNQNLVTYINQAVLSAMTNYVTSETFNLHLNNKNNPHSVTKEQVGLGNVENYSSADMPLSAEAENRFSQLAARFPSFDYNDLQGLLAETLDPEVIYIVGSSFRVEEQSEGSEE